MYNHPVFFTETNKYGACTGDDVYTVAEFLEHVENGSFIDYDGFGHPVKDRKADQSITIKPSSAKVNLPKDATHVIWYNR